MFSSKYNQLDEVHKILYQQVAQNPAFNIVINSEKKDLEHYILTSRQLPTELDSTYCRRISAYQNKLDLLQDLLSLSSDILN